MLTLTLCALLSPPGADLEAPAWTLLEARCLRCHDESARKGGLSLATRAAALEGGGHGPAITPGRSSESLLVKMASGEKPKMPKQAEPLETAEVAALRAWIDAGASWPTDRTLRAKDGEAPQWWSLQPIPRPAVPAAGEGWACTPVDRFVAAKLAEMHLPPSPEADRRTLIRRLTFDLHGLPPSPGEVDQFVADATPDAYERLVDRLLASPRYGERWGRHWLDVVHYGESHGYDKDKRRPNAWPYRDYVIRALNEDKPYARFVEEQLAGDVLHPDEPDGILALGFIAAGPWDFVGHAELREGTVDKAITRSNDRDDMVATAMSTFTSVTAHCARCHDHKFDPITQDDYYGLQAVFAGVDRADRPYDSDRETFALRRGLQGEMKALEARLKPLEEKARATTSPEIAAIDAQLERVKSELAALPAGRQGSPSNGYHSDIAATRDVLKWVEVDLGRQAAIDRVVLVPARPVDFPDTPGFGFPLRFRVEAFGQDGVALTISDRASSDCPSPGDAPVVLECGGTRACRIRVTATRLWERTGDYCFAFAELEVLEGGKNAALGARVNALDSIEAGLWGKSRLVDGFSSRAPLGDAGDRAALAERRAAAQAEAAQLAERRKAAVDSLLDADLRDGLKQATFALEDAKRRLAALPPPKLVFAGASEFAPNGNFTPTMGSARAIHVLRRGDVKSPGPLAAPGALACLRGLARHFDGLDVGSREGDRRAALARWVTDPENPLSWRSIVNRVWQYHFGRGIVDTPNDFGRMGSRPTHPELLDWLARWFLEDGGSLKRLHRLLVTSAAYRQTSSGRADGERLDADDRFLWRMSRTRLEAEAVRDTVLAVSGKLDLTMGGPSVDHFFFKDDHSPIYDYTRFDVDSPASFRRSVYRFIVRSVPDPFMDSLDCADPSILTPRRTSTLTALQALALLNTPFMTRQAEHFAGRLKAISNDPARQVDAAFHLVFARGPSSRETEELVAYAARYGLENACRLILNSNELLFID